MRDDYAAPLPRRLLRWTEADGELLPAWLTARDWPWLRDLLAEAQAIAGRAVRELEQRWRQSDGDPRAGAALPAARHVLLSLLRTAAARPSLPGVARRAVFFGPGAGLPELALQQLAARLQLQADALRAELFADLPGERRLGALAIGPAHLALVFNRALAQGLLLTATSATLQLRGAARAVLRTAWLHGGGLTVDGIDEQPAAAGDSPPLRAGSVRLRWSAGERSARRRRRALAAILPVLPWSRWFELRADCQPGGQGGRLVLGSADPILPGAQPRPFDSALERTFARDFAVAAPDWELLREPVPALVGAELVFPDFELRRRTDGARWLLEIAGLRRAEALDGKLRALTALPRLLLCAPTRAIPAAWARHPRVIAFARRVDVGLVVERLEAVCRSAP